MNRPIKKSAAKGVPSMETPIVTAKRGADKAASEKPPSAKKPKNTNEETLRPTPSLPTGPIAIDDDVLQNHSLDALQDEEQRRIMDMVDRLRRTGLSGILELPQLVVCGDQSSGKSSVLEAITEIPVPRKENLCTRFATEIVLRRDAVSSITTRITPDKGRPQVEQEDLLAWNQHITKFKDLPNIMRAATLKMGLQAAGQGKAFSRDVLTIVITGPKRPQLTVVDLPGLIKSSNKAQTKADVDMIHELVDQYIQNPRTIILAVISAKNDYANQEILEKARKYDELGERTLGIITKPDFLRRGSENEALWLELAQNKDIHLSLGWHMLKNRADDEHELKFDKRNASEAEFFSEGAYAGLERAVLGIETLRARLSSTLTDHLRRELPILQNELDEKLTKVSQQIASLGPSRETIHQQKRCLMDLSMKSRDIFKSAVCGHYEHEFFGRVDADGKIDTGTNIKRLRAVVQALNLQFSSYIRLCGHKFTITDESGADLDEQEPDDQEAMDIDAAFVTHSPKRLTKKEAVDWVRRVLQRSRGRELPGNFNPTLISDLFWEQSSRWKDIAREHISRVDTTCRNFVRSVIGPLASEKVVERLQTRLIEQALDESRREAELELDKLIEDQRRQPITYNSQYVATIQKMRRQKHGQTFTKLAQSSQQEVHMTDLQKRSIIDPALLEQLLESETQKDSDKFSAEEALDCMLAYSQHALKSFVDNVTQQAIERHLVSTLPEKLLSPVIISNLSEKDISYIAAESKHITEKRKHLMSQKEVLERGRAVFRHAV